MNILFVKNAVFYVGGYTLVRNTLLTGGLALALALPSMAAGEETSDGKTEAGVAASPEQMMALQRCLNDAVFESIRYRLTLHCETSEEEGIPGPYSERMLEMEVNAMASLNMEGVPDDVLKNHIKDLKITRQLLEAVRGNVPRKTLERLKTEKEKASAEGDDLLIKYGFTEDVVSGIFKKYYALILERIDQVMPQAMKELGYTDDNPPQTEDELERIGQKAALMILESPDFKR